MSKIDQYLEKQLSGELSGCKEILETAVHTLVSADIEEAKLDGWYIFSHTFSMDRARYYMEQLHPLTAKKEDILLFWKRVEERTSRTPLQYILGCQEFMGLDFMVNPSVLIPRQDTETLVERVLLECRDWDVKVLDLCTGSGCIAISLKKLGGYRVVEGLDISTAALEVAQENGKRICGDETGPHFFNSDLFSEVKGTYDVIVSNPPYIPTKVIEGLLPEVRDNEPVLALDGMEDGLWFYRRIIEEAPGYLKPGGRIYLEIGYDQGQSVTELLRAQGFLQIEVIKDEPGLDRVVKGVL